MTSCCGPSFEDRRTFTVRPFGVFSQGSSGLDRIRRSDSGEDTVQGFDTAHFSRRSASHVRMHTLSDTKHGRPGCVAIVPTGVDVVQTGTMLEVGAVDGKLVIGIEFSFQTV